MPVSTSEHAHGLPPLGERLQTMATMMGQTGIAWRLRASSRRPAVPPVSTASESPT